MFLPPLGTLLRRSALVLALAGGSVQPVMAEDGTILVQRHVAPRTAFRADSPKSPKVIEVQVSPAATVTAQTQSIVGMGSSDDALLGDMRAGQMPTQAGGATAMAAGQSAVALGNAAGAAPSGAGRSTGSGGFVGGIGNTVVNAMSPILAR
ncbi:hypothetical protein [Jeongeupia chitinilytica]|uniref:Uncharacterized protein n=1 Tax=Jeongeupia chitinilytica TaxID=1041641 RepID=A0ABQ3H4W4_9NEIS|nr:hypothetical protein [Jeongeupia chitinilytica]GHD66398.1 hypothetical protein GCM10007350_28560 [Jeongeupia chitinilytica]